MLRTSWVYTLKKEELVLYLAKCDQNTTGTVDELRKRFVKFLELKEEQLKQLLTWQAHHEANTPEPALVTMTEAETNSTSAKKEVNQPTCGANAQRVAPIEIVRKWGLKYDGCRDPFAFVEQVEELGVLYKIELNDVMRVMSELLKEKALIWFQNNNKKWAKWSHFKRDLCDFFVPRIQRPYESFQDYVLALQEFMRNAELTAEQKLDRIFYNSHIYYQVHIRRQDFNSLDELIALASGIDSVRKSATTPSGEQQQMIQTQPYEKKRQLSPSCHRFTTLTWYERNILADIYCNYHPVTGLIDTGSMVSLISLSMVQEIVKTPQYQSTEVGIRFGNGSRAIATKAICLMVHFGNIEKKHVFFVVETLSEPLILGMNFLNAFNSTLSCAGLTVWSSKTPPLNSAKKK